MIELESLHERSCIVEARKNNCGAAAQLFWCRMMSASATNPKCWQRGDWFNTQLHRNDHIEDWTREMKMGFAQAAPWSHLYWAYSSCTSTRWNGRRPPMIQRSIESVSATLSRMASSYTRTTALLHRNSDFRSQEWNKKISYLDWSHGQIPRDFTSRWW